MHENQEGGGVEMEDLHVNGVLGASDDANLTVLCLRLEFLKCRTRMQLSVEILTWYDSCIGFRTGNQK